MDRKTCQEDAPGRRCSLCGGVKQGSELWNVEVMLKTWPLCTGAKLNFGDRVLGEAEKSSFIALPGKESKTGSCPQIMCPNLGKIGRGFLVTFQRGHDQLVDILLMGWW